MFRKVLHAIKHSRSPSEFEDLKTDEQTVDLDAGMDAYSEFTHTGHSSLDLMPIGHALHPDTTVTLPT